MSKKIVFFLILGLIIAGVIVLNFARPKNPLPAVTSQPEVKKIVPSETLKEYIDPTGFKFDYPDNLTLAKKDTDDSTYADILLSARGVNGSLNLKISDSKFKSLDSWVGLNRGVSKEQKLGNLKAMEIKTADRLLLAALDQGIFFNIEIPLIDDDFWMKVYDILLSNFSFVLPQETESTTSDEVTFEGEEVIE